MYGCMARVWDVMGASNVSREARVLKTCDVPTLRFELGNRPSTCTKLQTASCEKKRPDLEIYRN